MLLQQLKEYADARLKLPPRLYAQVPVRYIIELDTSGRLLNPTPTDTADRANSRTDRGTRRHAPSVQRTNKIKPLLLADNAEYTLGRAREKSRPERVQECHRAYLDLLAQCARETGEPAVQAVLQFLQNDPLGRLALPDDFDPGALITFRVGDTFVIDLPAVQVFWAQWNDPAAAGAPKMQCLVCGHERPVLRRLQEKVKGVPGGQTAGTAIISANAAAFESYGLSESLIAPTCAECGEKFTKAINALLRSPQNRLILGGAAFVFWTREDVNFSLTNLLNDPQPDDVRRLLESVYTGRQPLDIDETAFYATALSGSGGRTVVRDWIDTTVGQVRRNLARWFTLQQIVGPYGEEPRPLGIYALAAATVRDPSKELAPPTPRALLRAALTGTPLPPGLLYQAVKRNRAEQTVTRPRAALIKLALLSQEQGSVSILEGADQVRKEDSMVQLDPSHPNVAYHCGRLLAVLEQVQRLAIPGAQTTIVDRFFGTASSAPASVFGRLLRGAQPHLAKLERDRRPAYMALQRRLEEILARIGAFPRTLTLEEQGLFALGYYHQRAYDRAQARQRAATASAAALEAEVVEDEPESAAN
jgi:CRISPR-associated protein Csd1